MATQYNAVQSNLPGSIPSWQWGIQYEALTAQLAMNTVTLQQAKQIYQKFTNRNLNQEIEASSTNFNEIGILDGSLNEIVTEMTPLLDNRNPLLSGNS